ncbi:putative RNA methyltransferase [Calycina marina]|uniref:RNA methyltransferase n=1 Tax=Calycina marina TaxID=1763456 RepID=A0A9P7Z0Z5_9HELO|nr:putative RNA methyltransferase [Calycina marina]
MGRKETYTQKRKRISDAKSNLEHPTKVAATGKPKSTTNAPVEDDTSRPTAVFKPTQGRDWTVSVALPGSIIANAQSHDLKTTMVGQIARALSVFCVDEVVVFDDGNAHPAGKPVTVSNDGYTGKSDPDRFLVEILSFLETPPHLRKLLFPMQPNLKSAGTLPSLDLPHHLKAKEWCPYREGVTLPGSGNEGTLVEAGLRIPVTVEDEIPENHRVTLKFLPDAELATKDYKAEAIKAEAVSPEIPREEAGYYWGFAVRKAASLSTVFTESKFEGGYDMTIGTSERGVNFERIFSDDEEQKVGKFRHLLIVFGGVAGLEVAVKNDAELKNLGVADAKAMFDRWINVCPGQGSRTIRTEEAVWIGLMGLRRLVVNN